MSIARFIHYVLAAAFVLTVGCNAPKPTSTPNPLTGFNFCFSQDPDKLDKAIKDDYQDYIQKLSRKDRDSRGPVSLFEDGTGQHAVAFETGRNGTSWRHVLIYDRDDKRTKVISCLTSRLVVAGEYVRRILITISRITPQGKLVFRAERFP